MSKDCLKQWHFTNEKCIVFEKSQKEIEFDDNSKNYYFNVQNKTYYDRRIFYESKTYDSNCFFINKEFQKKLIPLLKESCYASFLKYSPDELYKKLQNNKMREEEGAWSKTPGNIYTLETNEYRFSFASKKDIFFIKGERSKNKNTSKKRYITMIKCTCGHVAEYNMFRKKVNKKIELLFSEMKDKNPGFFQKFLLNENLYDLSKIYEKTDDCNINLKCPCCGKVFDYKNKTIKHFENKNILNDVVIYNDNGNISLVYYYKKLESIHAACDLYSCYKSKIVINTKTGQSYFIGPWKRNDRNTYVKFEHFGIKNITYGIHPKLYEDLNPIFKNNNLLKSQEKIVKTDILRFLFKIILDEKCKNKEFKKTIKPLHKADFYNKYKEKTFNTENMWSELSNICFFNKQPVLWNDPIFDKVFYHNDFLDKYKEIKIYYPIIANIHGVKFDYIDQYVKKEYIKLLRNSHFITYENFILRLIEKNKIPKTKKMMQLIFENECIIMDYKIFKQIGFKDINIFYTFAENNFYFYQVLDAKKMIQQMIKTKGAPATSKFLIENYAHEFYNDVVDIYRKILLYSGNVNPFLMKGNLKEIHDKLSFHYHSLQHINVEIAYDKKELLLNDKIDDYNIILAKDTHSLLNCGMHMKICVGSYRNQALEKTSTILFVKKELDYICCIELKNKQLIQVKGICNSKIPFEIGKIILQWFKKNQINYETCYDFKHILSNQEKEVVSDNKVIVRNA